MRFLLLITALFLSIFSFSLLADSLEELDIKDAPRPVVLELFTSQGCSSCPPADWLLGEFIKQYEGQVIALSFHVDYWDPLGWKDPFSSKKNTNRQVFYNETMGRRIYTPQMVVDGRFQVIGSRKNTIISLIKKASADMISSTIYIRKKEPIVEVYLPIQDYTGKADIYLIGYDRKHETDIKRGENSGRYHTNYNVVRSIEQIGEWDGSAATFSGKHPGTKQGIVLLQDSENGHIIGVASL